MLGCGDHHKLDSPDEPYVMILGIAQDAGFPQIGCDKDCCKEAWVHKEMREYATSMAIIDPVSEQWWLLECTPDIKDQLNLVKDQLGKQHTQVPDGILLTHGHMGHYGGLMHFGREAMGSSEITVYAMPRMYEYLANNGPWSQLVALKNITLAPIEVGEPLTLNERISVRHVYVPHRDEYTETVGYAIEGPTQTILFIPDIDKWSKWETDLEDVLKEVDLAFLDGTFYSSDEINGRDMSEIPHPFIPETMELIESDELRSKIRFIHFNHTNPVMNTDSDERSDVLSEGFSVAAMGETYPL